MIWGSGFEKGPEGRGEIFSVGYFLNRLNSGCFLHFLALSSSKRRLPFRYSNFNDRSKGTGLLK